jgi:truncated hemoglobin YjbI
METNEVDHEFRSAEERRAALVTLTRKETGIDEAMIETLIRGSQPMAKHMRLAVDSNHFDRWLALFEETARDLCPPLAAERFIERARRVAESLELGVASANGVLLQKGERYRRQA